MKQKRYTENTKAKPTNLQLVVGHLLYSQTTKSNHHPYPAIVSTDKSALLLFYSLCEEIVNFYNVSHFYDGRCLVNIHLFLSALWNWRRRTSRSQNNTTWACKNFSRLFVSYFRCVCNIRFQMWWSLIIEEMERKSGRFERSNAHIWNDECDDWLLTLLQSDWVICVSVAGILRDWNWRLNTRLHERWEEDSERRCGRGSNGWGWWGVSGN